MRIREVAGQPDRVPSHFVKEAFLCPGQELAPLGAAQLYGVSGIRGAAEQDILAICRSLDTGSAITSPATMPCLWPGRLVTHCSPRARHSLRPHSD